ncbi:MAG: glycosyltransferase [Candidatus Woesebacteria bacterium]|nr:glycosyltransferase [Candidatus Woesebacteria bacterium]
MRIVIDGRFYGLENAGLGRYTINLISELQKLDTTNEYYVLLRKKHFNQLNLNSNWEKILVDINHYSLQEQLKLSKIISKLKPDLVHFLHFNVPIFFKGKFVVTIHDLLMHKQKGLEATTLTPSKYLLKRLGYKFVFGNAVKKAVKVIVPSQAVKDEVCYYYKLNTEKVVVAYEGI